MQKILAESLICTNSMIIACFIFYQTSALIGAWKCNIPPFKDIVTDLPNNQPANNQQTDGRTDLPDHKEITL